MPKISNNSFNIYHNGNPFPFKVEINYNQENGFYAVLPDQFDVLFDLLDSEQLKFYKAKKIYKGKWQKQTYRRCVSTTTEAETLEAAKTIIKYFIGLKAKKKNVIVVFYKSNIDDRIHENIKAYKSSKLDFSFHFVYAVEETVGDNKPIYNIIYEDQAFGETRINRDRVAFGYKETPLIVDDTPENRAYLEYLHSAFQKLIEKMDEFTANSETLLDFINSGQKFLPSETPAV